MSVIWITSDWHLGHRSVARWRAEKHPSIISEDNHDEYLLDTWASTVRKRDVVWCLGDMLMGPNHVQAFRSLPGRKRLVLGNHDTDHHGKRSGLSDIDRACIFEEVHGMVKYKWAWLTHAPIHPEELRGKYNIHGHTHNHSIDDYRYINACPEANNFQLINFQQLTGTIIDRHRGAE